VAPLAHFRNLELVFERDVVGKHAMEIDIVHVPYKGEIGLDHGWSGSVKWTHSFAGNPAAVSCYRSSRGAFIALRSQ